MPRPDSSPSVTPDDRPAAASRRPRGISIGVLLAVTLSGLVALAVASVLAINFSIGRSSTIELLRDRGELATQAIEAQVRDQLDPAIRQLDRLAAFMGSPDFSVDDRQRVTDLLVGALSSAPQITRLVFISAAGLVTVVDQAEDRLNFETVDRADTPLVRQTLANAVTRTEGWWGDLTLDPRGGRQAQFGRRHSVWRGSAFQGEIAAQVNVRTLSAGLPTVTTGSAAGNSFILYDRNFVLAHPRLLQPVAGLTPQRPLPGIAEVDDPVLAAIWDPIMSLPILGGRSGFHVVNVAGVPHLYLYRVLDDYGPKPLIVGAWFRAADVFGELRRLSFAAAAGVLILAISCLAAVWLGRRIARPIKRLAAAANGLRQLDFSKMAELPQSRMRELAEQARAFNDMIGGLRWFSAYVPRPLVRHLLRKGSGRKFPSVEREVTVMFTDIVGFTSLAEHRSAADTAALLNHHFGLVTQAIEAQDGTVDKFIGDGAMAFWNAPHRHTDHARRAAFAALAIGEAIRADNRARAARGLAPIRVRIGIHTGRVVVGNIGPAMRLNYTIVGDTVNTAQRIEQLGHEVPSEAAEVTILVSESTRAQLDDGFDCRPVGRFSVRGRADLVEVSRLLTRQEMGAGTLDEAPPIRSAR